MDDYTLSLTLIKKEFDLDSQTATSESFVAELSHAINELIKTDLSRLINILYRLDVNEEKLRKILKENQFSDAGDLIAKLVIERQMQKIESRKQSGRDGDIPEDEKW